MNERRGVGRRERDRGKPGGQRLASTRGLPAAVLGGVFLGLAFFSVRTATAYEQRPNTFSLGLQGGAGVLTGQGKYVVTSPVDASAKAAVYPYDPFNSNWSGALAIRLRYSIDPTHAFGISMEDLRFPSSTGQANPVPGPDGNYFYPKQLQVNNYILDYYYYATLKSIPFIGDVGRREKACPYLVLGIGLHRDSFRFGASDVTIPPVGFVGNVGAGWEYFLRRPFSFDLSARLYYLTFSGGSGVAGEFMLGFQYYLLR